MTTEKILIIDPQQDLEDFYRTWLEPIELEIRQVTTGAAAIDLIQAEPFDLALLDLSLPDVDSLAVLRSLKEARPNLPVILSFDPTTTTTEQVTAAVNLRVDVFVEKPYQSEALLAAVWRTRELYPTGAIYGNLRDLTLPNIVSLICSEGRTASMEIQHRSQIATIFFEKGQVVHAQLSDLAGEEAIFEALAWEDGDFTITFGHHAPEQTIETSWSGLMLAGMNRLDEAAFDQEQLEPEEPAAPSAPSLWTEEVEPLPAATTTSIELDLDTQMQVKDRLEQLHQTLNGRCTLLVNRNGRLFHAQGKINEGQSLALAALVASSFSANGEVAKMLAIDPEQDVRFQHSLQEGNHFNLYSAQVDSDWIVAVAFEPNATNLGLARQLTLQTAADLADLLAQSAHAADVFEGLNGVLAESDFEDLFAQALED